LPDDPAQSPVGTLRRDLHLLCGRTTLAVLTGGLVLGLVVGPVKGQVIILVLGIAGATAVLPALGLRPWTVTASSVYLCAVAILGIRKHIPGRLMRFLDDAHRVGLLRRVGPVYQFRHAKLQDRLAHTHRQRT
jgi:hypothetical protein